MRVVELILQGSECLCSALLLSSGSNDIGDQLILFYAICGKDDLEVFEVRNLCPPTIAMARSNGPESTLIIAASEKSLQEYW